MIPISRPAALRRALPFALLAAVAFAISGCGRAGPLEPPPSAVAKPADSSNGGFQVHKSNPPITAPKTPFVLDPLL